jgi:hypothetical protein
MVRGSGGRLAAMGIALAGLAPALAGCSHVLPLGPAPAPTPAPRHLSSAIVLDPGLSQPADPPGSCPAGSVTLSGPGTPSSSPVGDPAAATSGVCFRPLGQPVTFTSAGVTMYQQPGGSQPVPHPALWELRITLPAAEATALTTITTKVAGTQDQLAIIVAGQTWGMPLTRQPLTQGQFVILMQSRNEALQLQHLLLKPA